MTPGGVASLLANQDLTFQKFKIMLTDLSGQIERITYTDDKSGFTIARIKVYGRRDLVTIAGSIMAPAPGEILKMQGEWVNHPKFGEQFKVVHYSTSVPATVFGIEKYLGSGLIKGIGPVMAKRIVKKFGKKTLDVIEEDIGQLTQVAGIGKKRIGMIEAAWEEQKEIRSVMLFLQTHGVGSGYATKIFKEYKSRSIEVVRENPYRLATDIFGIGFVTADSIAEKLGFPKDCQVRVEAGIIYTLHQLSDEGHVYYPYEPLLEKCGEILQVERDIIVEALGTIAVEKKVVIQDLNESFDEFKENNKAVFLSKFHVCETGISFRLKRLGASAKSIRPVDPDKAVSWVQGKLDINLAEKQENAIRAAINSKVMVITGGPGTGKTTIINGVLKIFLRLNINIMLAAPTGRAAKRMQEACGHEAKTIHRMLSFSFADMGFKHNEDNPLGCDLLIVDEASMIDTVLMHHLLKAVPIHATFILVGDVNQLPSVGAGNVLNDIIGSNCVPVVRLKDIFRQAKQSQIIVNAHKINRGDLRLYENAEKKGKDQDSDFYFIEQEEPEKVLKTIVQLAEDRIPGRFGFDPIDDIQVLTPMHKGVVGAGNLNTELQKALNPGETGVMRGGRSFKVGDKVMQIKNNYDKDVFNGDIGRITNIHQDNQDVTISFDQKKVVYDFSDLDEIVLAYAVSIHKSQGSEYPVVVIPILVQHYILLQRNLIYTGVTRGRKLVVIVGTKKAMAIGIRNNETKRRYTFLKQRLAS